MAMREPISSAEIICKGVQIERVSERFGTGEDALSSSLAEMQGRLQAAETRVTAAVDTAKRELALTIQLAESEQRGLMLQQQLSELQQQAAQ